MFQFFMRKIQFHISIYSIVSPLFTKKNLHKISINKLTNYTENTRRIISHTMKQITFHVCDLRALLILYKTQ